MNGPIKFQAEGNRPKIHAGLESAAGGQKLYSMAQTHIQPTPLLDRHIGQTVINSFKNGWLLLLFLVKDFGIAPTFPRDPVTHHPFMEISWTN